MKTQNVLMILVAGLLTFAGRCEGTGVSRLHSAKLTSVWCASYFLSCKYVNIRTVIWGKNTNWVDQSRRRCSNYYFLSVYFIQASKAPLLKSVLQSTMDLCFVFAFVSYFSFMQMLTTPTWGKSTKKLSFFRLFIGGCCRPVVACLIDVT